MKVDTTSYKYKGTYTNYTCMALVTINWWAEVSVIVLTHLHLAWIIFKTIIWSSLHTSFRPHTDIGMQLTEKCYKLLGRVLER